VLFLIKENIFGWDQMYHDICEPELIREKKIIVNDDPLTDIIDESRPFDPRYFRPLMVTLRVALHNITSHLLHVNRKIFILIKMKFLYSIVIMNLVQLDFVNEFVLK
jgi:hypothetical protein